MKLSIHVPVICVAVAIGFFIGCEGAKPSGGGGETNNQDHDHDHDEDGHEEEEDGSHAHVHGPNDGEWIKFESKAFRGEIKTLKGENMLTIFIHENEKDEPLAIKADKIIGKLTKGREPQEFEFVAVNADDQGMASKFELNDQDARKAYDAFGLNLEVDVDGTIHKANVEKNPHPS